MRVTVCELPHEPETLAAAWAALCEHTARHSSELVLLPELAMVDPLWEDERFDSVRWSSAQALSEIWRRRFPELRVPHVVGTRPVTIRGRRFNEGFLWSSTGDLVPLRRKFFLPEEQGGWEARWFDRGDCEFPEYRAGAFSFGLNICTELWAVETYARYAALGVPMILSPRATAAATTGKWLSAGVVAAVRSAAFSLSSNRVDPTGACGGVGWIIDPYGSIVARTSAEEPFATADIVLSAAAEARDAYPGYVFRGRRVIRSS
jgi:N-carbamoylputrescine amidase